jgi:hypothetical protein
VLINPIIKSRTRYYWSRSHKHVTVLTSFCVNDREVRTGLLKWCLTAIGAHRSRHDTVLLNKPQSPCVTWTDCLFVSTSQQIMTVKGPHDISVERRTVQMPADNASARPFVCFSFPLQIKVPLSSRQGAIFRPCNQDENVVRFKTTFLSFS